MKRIIFCLMFVLNSSYSFAQEAKSDYIAKGTVAPYSGILLNPAAQAQMMANREFDKKKCDLDNQYNLLRMRADCDLQVGKLKVDLDIMTKKYETINKLKDDEIKKLNEIALKESQKSDRWIWWLISGVAAGMATTIGVTYAVNH